MKLLVNLGCGGRLITPPDPRWVVVNHDRTQHHPSVDVAHDLNERPWPWPDGIVSAVYALQVLEHLDIDLIASVNECWRILKTGGVLHLNLPLAGSTASHRDPTHRWYVTPETIDFYVRSEELHIQYGPIYRIKPWRLIRKGIMDNRASLFAELEKSE
jgi:SAM-dependent methyltransferase